MAHMTFMKVSKLSDLLKSAGGDLHVCILTTNQLALGVDPLNPTSVIDFSKEALLPTGGKPLATETSNPEPKFRSSRSTGRYSIEFKGKMIECRSLREVLAEGLKAIESHRPGTLEKLSAIKPRTKRIVAHEPKHLFEEPELVEKYSEKLMNGWWYGTNNSAGETKSWLKRACELARLTWGRDFDADL